VNSPQQITASLPSDVLQKPIGTVLKVEVELPAGQAGDPKIVLDPKELTIVA
jgi:hypothetical protein